MKNFLLVGNANTGKTTFLNNLTHSEEHTGNWHGVTTTETKKFFQIGKEKCSIVDLPGVYSLSPLSLDEKVTTDSIFQNKDATILNVCDGNNLQRGLLLTLELLEKTNNIILLINNFGKKTHVNIDELSKELGVDIYEVNFENKKEIKKIKNNLLKLNKNKTRNLKTRNIDEKYNYIKNILIKTNYKKRIYSNFLDKFFLNKFLSIPIFFGIMIIIFYLTFFSVGSTLSEFLSYIVQDIIGSWVCNIFESICSVDWVCGLVEDGLIVGVGSLISFLPQVVLLFLFLAIMENTGYFTRVAFIFEDFFSSVGLSGKSVYTLIMGFGCSASAILSSRTIENKNSRIKTAILTPYMSCSAKLPVYAVLGGAFFGVSNIWIIFLLYLLGVFTALFVSIILDKIGLKSQEENYFLEFPPYMFPKFRKILSLTWQNIKMFLIKVSTIFISMNVIVWCLSSFSSSFEYIVGTNGKSILQTWGEILAPIFAPIGFNNWGAVSALIAGIVAKEIIVSTLAIFNGFSTTSLNGVGNSFKDSSSVVCFTSSSAISYLSFCLLYCPCLASISVLNKEIGGKWTFVAVVLQLIVAYVVSFMVYRIYLLAESIGIINTIFILIALFGIIFSGIGVFSSIKNNKICNKCGKCYK